MKAVQANEFGGPEVLHLVDLAEPTPGPDQLLVRVEACGVCYHDVLTRSGLISRGVRLPFVPGHEIAGRVAGWGDWVSGFRLGELVCITPHVACGSCHYCIAGHDNLCQDAILLGHGDAVGGYSEFVVARARAWVKVPEGIPAAQAAILGCAVGTAYRATRDAGVAPGQTVVVTGAGGGVGLHAVQCARLAGARVLAITSGPEKREAIAGCGADEVIVDGGGGFHRQVRELTGGLGADVVIDCVGTPVWSSVMRSVGAGGKVAYVGQVSDDTVNFNPGQIVLRGISLLGCRGSTLSDLRQLLELVSRGRLRPLLTQEASLGEAAAAHALMESRKLVGRLVLRPGS